MLLKYRQHLNVVRDCIDKNQIVIKLMLNNNVLEGETKEDESPLHNLNGHNNIHHPKHSSSLLGATSGFAIDGPLLEANSAGDKDLHRLLKIRPQDMEHVSDLHSFTALLLCALMCLSISALVCVYFLCMCTFVCASPPLHPKTKKKKNTQQTA